MADQDANTAPPETRKFWCLFHFSWHNVRATTATLPNDGTECILREEKRRAG